ncbi:hypothetical protein SAMN05216218_10386 [Halorientalis regularis]|jgi:hypothetical protein|uniref:Uncharacterized protein n=1 Tax=Halorientalis regularis TaxID=660518 RepID=A0A1G7HMK2_9EURY|nr:hypothetical protein SAMN05216218_10386 [Halorientalis regularis]
MGGTVIYVAGPVSQLYRLRMVSTDSLVTAALGTAASAIGLFLLWLARTGSHEALRPPMNWGADLGLVSVEQTRTRRLSWAGYGVVSLLVGLVPLTASISVSIDQVCTYTRTHSTVAVVLAFAGVEVFAAVE